MHQHHDIRALFLNRHGPELMDYLARGLEGVPVRLLMPRDGERASLLEMVPEADVLIGWGSDPELLETATRMKLFINPGAGVAQHIEPFRALRQTRPVPLVNGHGNAHAVAQHTLALLLALTNKVIPHHQRMVGATPRDGSCRTTYLMDTTVGFLGYGAINKAVHRLMRGFDVKFVACRRKSHDPGPFPTPLQVFSTDQLHEFFKTADIVINALPAASHTAGLVTHRELSLLGPAGILVNVGRAATVVEEDLFKALKESIIAGAALDVWWPRPRETDSAGRRDPYTLPFHELDNLVMSPHRGADSGGDLRRWDEVIENLKRVQAGRTDFLNVVDVDAEY